MRDRQPSQKRQVKGVVMQNQVIVSTKPVQVSKKNDLNDSGGESELDRDPTQTKMGEVPDFVFTQPLKN